MADTFIPPIPPSFGTERDFEPRVLKADFGDGYTQRAADGLNHIRPTLSLVWEYLTPAEAQQIVDFFVGQGGWKAFWWTAPDTDATGAWICPKWKRKRVAYGQDSISATFERVYSIT